MENDVIYRLGCLGDVVVHDDDRSELGTSGGLLRRLGQPLGHLFGWVAAPLKSSPLFLWGRGLNKNQKRTFDDVHNLAGTLDVDLQNQVSAVGRIGGGRSVVVTQEFGVFQKPSFGDSGLEGVLGDENISLGILANAALPGCPRSTQPEVVGVTGNEFIDDSPFTDAARS